MNIIFKTPGTIFFKLFLASLLYLVFNPTLQAATGPVAEKHPLVNQLKNHASPYLALHGNDPVHWQDWGEAVIAQARKENKLIFISSGYFACHWCHVMQRESFSDSDIAGQLHQLAIPVKIDRELQPALDAWLIEFVERSNGHAGWPLNVFLTPDGYPLVGLTYRPRDSFSELLLNLQKRWNNDETHLRQLAEKAFESMKPAKRLHAGFKPGKKTTAKLAALLRLHALQLGDDIGGGFGQQNKFPMSPQLIALLDIQQRYPDQQLADFLRLTLDQMARLGMHDLIGGGFFRYVVDPGWDTPHFEKMLYDNAQLALVYLRAASILERNEYTQTARSTLDFILADMKHAGGGYWASLSAVDEKGNEGAYYLWSAAELQSLLSAKELNAVMTAWGLMSSTQLDHGHHLKRALPAAVAAQELSLELPELEQVLSSAASKLRQARSERAIPADDKVLAGWNGLLLRSLSEAAGSLNDKTYHDAAAALYRYLSTQYWDGKQLHRFTHQGQPAGQVSLQDYAYVADGMLAWARHSNDQSAWATAQKIAVAGLQRFHDEHGWQLSEKLPVPYDARELIMTDNTLPSASASLLTVLLDIARSSDDAQLEQQLAAMIETNPGELKTSPFWYASHISLISRMADSNQASQQSGDKPLR